MSLTKTERMAIELLRARIDPRHASHTSDVIPAAAQPYIDTWILPLIDYLEGKDRRNGDADDIRRNHASLARRAEMKAEALARRQAAKGQP